MTQPANDSPKPPWYRRPLPPHFPAWLVISIFLAIVGGVFAAWTAEPNACTLVTGTTLGFFGGLAFSLVLAGRASARSAKPISQFQPPPWLALPVGSAVVVIFASVLIDDSLRYGYFNWRRSPRTYRIPGPVAIGIACTILLLAGGLNARAIQIRRRSRSWLIGGLLGFAVLAIGGIVIVGRVVGN